MAAIGYAIAAPICFVLIITIPFGIASLRIGAFALWPFGKTVVRRADAGVASRIGNVQARAMGIAPQFVMGPNPARR